MKLPSNCRGRTPPQRFSLNVGHCSTTKPTKRLQEQKMHPPPSGMLAQLCALLGNCVMRMQAPSGLFAQRCQSLGEWAHETAVKRLKMQKYCRSALPIAGRRGQRNAFKTQKVHPSLGCSLGCAGSRANGHTKPLQNVKGATPLWEFRLVAPVSKWGA